MRETIKRCFDNMSIDELNELKAMPFEARKARIAAFTELTNEEKDYLHSRVAAHTVVKPSLWARIKRVVKGAGSKALSVLKTIGRKTVTVLKTTARFFRTHWGKLAWMTAIGVGFATVPVFTAIALGSTFLVILSVLSGVAVAAAYSEHQKNTQSGTWTADAAPAAAASN